MAKMIELGTCRKPHGIKGGFSVQLFNNEDSVLDHLDSLFLVPLDPSSSLPKEGKEWGIENVQLGNKAILYLEGVHSRNQVEEMIPFSVWVDREKFPDCEDGEIYLSDLIGLRVHVKGEDRGKVLNFYENGAQVVLVLLINGRKIEIPFVDAFVPSTDFDNGWIEVVLPEIV